MEDKIIKMTTCKICYERMDRRDHQPICLPQCGHSFCRQCLANMEANDYEIKCPTCRTLHTGASPTILPINWTLLDLMESDQTENDRSNTHPPTQSENLTSAPPHSTNEAPSVAISVEPTSDDIKPHKQKCDPPEDPASTSSGTTAKVLKGIGITAGVVAGGVGLVAAAPVVLTGVGFTSAGVAAGSWAASWMSAAAVANGGGVAAGSLVAVLQSAGAAGISAATTAALGTVGGAVGGGVAYAASKDRGGSSNDEGENSTGGHDPPDGGDSDGRDHSSGKGKSFKNDGEGGNAEGVSKKEDSDDDLCEKDKDSETESDDDLLT